MRKYFEGVPRIAIKFLKNRGILWNGKAISKMSGNMRIFLEKDISAEEIYNDGAFYGLVGIKGSKMRYPARIVIDIDKLSVFFEETPYQDLEHDRKIMSFVEEWICFVMQHLKKGKEEYRDELVSLYSKRIEKQREIVKDTIDFSQPYSLNSDEECFGEDDDFGFYSISNELSQRFMELEELNELEEMLNFINYQYNIELDEKEIQKAVQDLKKPTNIVRIDFSKHQRKNLKDKVEEEVKEK